jgi:hypothetical protein
MWTRGKRYLLPKDVYKMYIIWPSNLEGEETGKDITGTDIESQNQEAEAAADDVIPVQIERRLNKLSTLIVHSLTPVPFFQSFCIHDWHQ